MFFTWPHFLVLMFETSHLKQLTTSSLVPHYLIQVPRKSIYSYCAGIFATPAPTRSALRQFLYVPLSYLPRREERGKGSRANCRRASEGVGIPRKTVAQYPNYRKSRGAISASAAAALRRAAPRPATRGSQV